MNKKEGLTALNHCPIVDVARKGGCDSILRSNTLTEKVEVADICSAQEPSMPPSSFGPIACRKCQLALLIQAVLTTRRATVTVKSHRYPAELQT